MKRIGVMTYIVVCLMTASCADETCTYTHNDKGDPVRHCRTWDFR